MVKEVLYACQAVNGRYLTMPSDDSGNFLIDPALPAPIPERQLMLKLAELGWLVRWAQGILCVGGHEYCSSEAQVHACKTHIHWETMLQAFSKIQLCAVIALKWMEMGCVDCLYVYLASLQHSSEQHLNPKAHRF